MQTRQGYVIEIKPTLQEKKNHQNRVKPGLPRQYLCFEITQTRIQDYCLELSSSGILKWVLWSRSIKYTSLLLYIIFIHQGLELHWPVSSLKKLSFFSLSNWLKTSIIVCRTTSERWLQLTFIWQKYFGAVAKNCHQSRVVNLIILQHSTQWVISWTSDCKCGIFRTVLNWHNWFLTFTVVLFFSKSVLYKWPLKTYPEIIQIYLLIKWRMPFDL